MSRNPCKRSRQSLRKERVNSTSDYRPRVCGTLGSCSKIEVHLFTGPSCGTHVRCSRTDQRISGTEQAHTREMVGGIIKPPMPKPTAISLNWVWSVPVHADGDCLRACRRRPRPRATPSAIRRQQCERDRDRSACASPERLARVVRLAEIAGVVSRERH